MLQEPSVLFLVVFQPLNCFDAAENAETSSAASLQKPPDVQATADTSSSLASCEPSVLSTDSGPASEPAAGTLGEYVLKKAACMPSMKQKRMAPITKATSTESTQASLGTHAAVVSRGEGPNSPSSSESDTFAVPARDASQPLPAVTESSASTPRAPVACDITPSQSRSEALQTHASLPVAAITSGTPQHRHTHSAAPATPQHNTSSPTATTTTAHGLIEEAQEILEASDVPGGHSVEQKQYVEPQQRQRPVSANPVTTVGAPQATAARCEARRVRSARLARRRSGEWGSSSKEGAASCWTAFSFKHAMHESNAPHRSLTSRLASLFSQQATKRILVASRASPIGV